MGYVKANDKECSEIIRSLLESVTVSCDRARWHHNVMMVTGGLNSLHGEAACPNALLWDGSGRGTRTPDTRIMIPLL